MAESQTFAQNIRDEPTAFGDSVADAVARFGGSWKFIGTFGAILIGWMLVNAWVLIQAFDPYPFILLNLVLSSRAALQAPVIMMSQNRSAQTDRQRAEHYYQVNLKAELEVRLLNEKLDRLLLHEWPKMVQLQELQVDMLEELSERQSRPAPSARRSKARKIFSLNFVRATAGRKSAWEPRYSKPISRRAQL